MTLTVSSSLPNVSVDRSFRIKMAPSVRGAGTRMRQAQPTLLGYAKVTKSKKFEPTTKIRAKGVKITIQNVEVVSNNISEGGPIASIPSFTSTTTEACNKRKRGISLEESDVEEAPTGKKVMHLATVVSCHH